MLWIDKFKTSIHAESPKQPCTAGDTGPAQQPILRHFPVLGSRELQGDLHRQNADPRRSVPAQSRGTAVRIR